MESKRPAFWPVLVLFFLAPAIGELLSGSSPPAEFFRPFNLSLLAAMYGSGAILVRELRVRWAKGWPNVLVLGVVYGIVEEGLACKSFFNPNWPDLGALGSYGRWAGVNWVWSLYLAIFHAVFSITIPILLTELLFPAHCNERWLGRKGMLGFSLLLAADVLFCFLAFPYRPPVLHLLVTVMAIVALFFLARRFPAGGPQPLEVQRVPRPRWFALLGLAANLAFFFGLWVLPNLAIPVGLTLFFALVLAGVTAWAVRSLSRGGAWRDEHRLALVAGALMFFVLIAPIQELDPARMDNTKGMGAVGLLTLFGLIWLWRRVRTHVRMAALASEPQKAG